jgi:aldose sugar dehydrogenase
VRTTAAAALLVSLLLAACGPGLPSLTPTPAPPVASLIPTPAGTSAAEPASGTLAPPGPLRFTVQTVAQGLEAPWAVAFAPDGSIWVTERPGRVRVIRNGRLLPTPALVLSVVSRPGIESGVLGLAIGGSSAYVAYTHGGPQGSVDRVSRFTIQGDHLTGERVLLDGIPGGGCCHYGGRLKLGPDGLLYVSTGDGYVASRAATRGGLSGKILRMRTDGSGLQMFAWGLRNPEGIAFDPAGRLYASNNGPTGEFGLCCHDEIDLIRQGGFYGWPAWAANTRTSYPQDGMPQRIPPMAESGTDTWAPSGITLYSPRAGEQPTLLMTELRGQALRRFVIDAGNPALVRSQQIVLSGQGRLRDVVAGPDGCAYVLTTNRDGRGVPRAGDDRLLRLCPA